MRFIYLLFFLLPAKLLTAQYQYYYGNIHAHTAYSDGNVDSSSSGITRPGQAYDYAKQSYHMDFLGISEHNHFNATNNPGMHRADYANGIFQADTANRNGSFVCLYGMEWGVISNGGHLVTYGIPGLVGWETGSGLWGGSDNYDIYCWKYDYSRFWQIVNSYPYGFCTLAHPQSGDYNDLYGTALYDVSADSAVAGVAIRSGSAFSTTTDYSDPAPTSYESVYKKMLAKGYHVGPACDQDNHYSTYGRTSRIRTVVLAQSLHRDSILAAYKALRFYASEDWDTQVDFNVNGYPMGSQFTAINPATLSVTVSDPGNTSGGADPVAKIELYYGIPGSGSNATVLNTVTNSTSLSYVHSTNFGDTYYYYAKITQTDGDIVWTTPIWVTNAWLILPLDLMSLTGKADGETNLVHWETAQQTTTTSFVIEHALAGESFDSIGLVTASHPFQTQFQFIHRQPGKGVHVYRLRITEDNGRVSYSPTVLIRRITPLLQSMAISPNPVTENSQINIIAAASSTIQLRLYNSDGRLVLHQTMELLEGNNVFPFPNHAGLSAGLYYLVAEKPGERLAETTVFIP
jgi:hypothetical protein